MKYCLHIRRFHTRGRHFDLRKRLMFKIIFAIGKLVKQLATLLLALLKLWIVMTVAFFSPKLAQELFNAKNKKR